MKVLHLRGATLYNDGTLARRREPAKRTTNTRAPKSDEACVPNSDCSDGCKRGTGVVSAIDVVLIDRQKSSLFHLNLLRTTAMAPPSLNVRWPGFGEEGCGSSQLGSDEQDSEAWSCGDSSDAVRSRTSSTFIADPSIARDEVRPTPTQPLWRRFNKFGQVRFRVIGSDSKISESRMFAAAGRRLRDRGDPEKPWKLTGAAGSLVPST